MDFFAWFVVISLILVNALYVAAEFGAVGVRRSRISQLAQGGNSLAKRLLSVVQDARELDRYVAACQIGITLSSLVLGAYGQATIARDLATLLRDAAGFQPDIAASTGAAVVLLFLTALQVVFGELVPKSLALQYPTRTALYTYLPMQWSLGVYSWFIAILNGSGIFILKALGVSQVGRHRHIHSPEEIDMLIAESRNGGLLEPEEQRRLHQALRLGQLTARQVMVPRRMVAMVNFDTPPEQILQIAIESPYTRLPVYRGDLDNVIGYLHTKDLAAYYAEHGRLTPLPMRRVTTVPSSVTIERLLTAMRSEKSRLVVLLDEFGATEGIVTLDDVLAELVGDVADEFKGDQPAPERLPDGRVRLPGLLQLREAASWTGLPGEDEEVDTVAGLVLSELGAIPKGGERLVIDGVTVEVERMDGHIIASLLVTPKASGPDQDKPGVEKGGTEQ